MYPAVLGHGSATVGPGPQRPGTAGFGGNNMFASAGDSPGMPLQALQGNNQRRPGTAANMFGNAGGGNRLGGGAVGGGNGMRMGLPRSNMGVGGCPATAGIAALASMVVCGGCCLVNTAITHASPRVVTKSAIVLPCRCASDHSDTVITIAAAVYALQRPQAME